jgi:hypothetical protein
MRFHLHASLIYRIKDSFLGSESIGVCKALAIADDFELQIFDN